jgi:hypothetical protein
MLELFNQLISGSIGKFRQIGYQRGSRQIHKNQLQHPFMSK